MTDSMKAKTFDLLLSSAFANYEEKINGEIPSDEELAGRYSIPAEEVRSVLKYQKRAEKVKRYGKPLGVIYLRRAVAIVLISVTVLFGATMLNGEVRAAIGKAIVQFFEKYVRIIPTSGSEQSGDESGSLNIYDFDVLSHIPEAYEIVNISEEEQKREFDFINNVEYDLYVCIEYSEGSSISMDNEITSVEQIEIDGNEAYRQIDMTETPHFVNIIIIKNNIVLIVYGYESVEVITEIAEAIIKQ